MSEKEILSIFREKYLIASTAVADEFYPKGHPRRGEYLRDQAMIFAKLAPNIVPMFKQLQDPHRMAFNSIIEDLGDVPGTNAAHDTAGRP